MYGSASGSSGSALLLLLSAEAEGSAEEGPAAEDAEAEAEVDWELDAEAGVEFCGVAWGSMTRSWTITGGSMGRRSAAHGAHCQPLLQEA